MTQPPAELKLLHCRLSAKEIALEGTLCLIALLVTMGMALPFVLFYIGKKIVDSTWVETL